MTANRIRTLRREQGMTYADLAQSTGLPIRLLAEIEHGLRAIEPDQLALIAQALGTAPQILTPIADANVQRMPRYGSLPLSRIRNVWTSPWMVALLLGVITCMLRAISLDRSWNVWVDEIRYFLISQSVATTFHTQINGNHFYLHPPAFFFIEAAYIKIIQPSGNIFQQVYTTRYLNAILSVLTVWSLWAIARHISTRWVSIAIATSFAIEPFIIRMNSHNLLDTAAVFWIVLGYALIISTLDNKPQSNILNRHKFAEIPLLTSESKIKVPSSDILNQKHQNTQAIVAGICFGLALLTKEMTSFLIFIPLLICYAHNQLLTRRNCLKIALIAILVYLPFPFIVMAMGGGEDLFFQKSRGLARILGVIQETGFNQEGGPSFLEALIRNMDNFATTYIIIGSGIIASGLLLLRGGAANRLVAIWTISAYLLLGYGLLFGTIEEHFFYFLVVPALLATICAGHIGFQLLQLRVKNSKILRTGMAITVSVFMIWCSIVWVKIHFTPDNGYERLYTYLQHHVPAKSRVAMTTPISQYLDQGYEHGNWGTIEAWETNQVEYVILGTREVATGYGTVRSKDYEWLVQYALPVFIFEGHDADKVVMYQIPKDAWSTSTK